MVYESDFYTTRRPYSSRPNVSSYSVTSRIYSTYPTWSDLDKYTWPSYTAPYYTSYPSVWYNSIPYIAHKRLVTGTRILDSPTRYVSRVVSSPVRTTTTTTYRYVPSYYPTYIPSYYPTYLSSYIPYRISSLDYPLSSLLSYPSRYLRTLYDIRSVSPIHEPFRVRPSILYREYDRIENKLRTYPHHSYTDSYLNSESVKRFDDETREIRAKTQELMSKVHEPVRRAQSVLPSSYLAKYERRYGPDPFVSYLGPLSSSIYNGLDSYYPSRYLGKSHLAAIRILGDKVYNQRRATSYFDDDKVRNDVNLLSYYLRSRRAATEDLGQQAKLKTLVEGPLISEVAA